MPRTQHIDISDQTVNNPDKEVQHGDSESSNLRKDKNPPATGVNMRHNINRVKHTRDDENKIQSMGAENPQHDFDITVDMVMKENKKKP